MKIGVIGCGNMGQAFISHLSKKHQVLICDRKEEHLSSLKEKYGVEGTIEVEKVGKECETIFLAVKPKDFVQLAKTLEGVLQKDALVISMLAGIDYETLKLHFGKAKAVRIMPNLPVHVGRGVIGVEDDPEYTEKFRMEVRQLFADLGTTYFVSAKGLDGFVSLTGGGPAFFCVFLEGLIEAGIQLGFRADIAKELAEKTVEGSVALLQERGLSTQAFRWMNCSPGGTTIEGIQVLEESGMRGAIMDACKAAYEKAFQLES